MKTTFTALDYLYYASPIFLEGFAAGWETGSIGGILAMPQFLDYFSQPSSFRQGSMTACLIAGEFGGSLFTGFFVSDRFGRKKTIIFSGILYIIGQIIVVASINQAMFITGRVLNGFGAGGLIQSVPL
jgi:MFS family permease